VGEDVLELLARHEWPGNVRELRNTLERMAILADGNRLTPADVPFAPRGAVSPLRDLVEAAVAPVALDGPTFLDATTFEEFKELSERAYLVRALARHGWNIQQTARSLAMQRSNLYKKIEKYGLNREAPS
jgi:two-component system nitrogen regulation response regulator NtrX